ncbi:hypothetical protein M409DRAFT_17378 [Zasmidium cellare ATCC 36951]|uniref:Methyltransferase domain-containing protein n=1 Tax=Zasmidium cellare ATCC 36951 TaxID=1080233 RepID=A0A6A6D144_ZASCE|nr:uncharacterized protein M409DRAFT_17378 [Zasmidium cellare ATCC 36951]KAF2172138.1 hypothetical protein M409DRAFT_17378 [Zasmidium cellare ATCC 36951]
MAIQNEPLPLTDRDIQFQKYFTALAPNYHHLTSNTTYFIAQKALSLAPPPTDSTALIHDNASGPGTASLALISHYESTDTPIPHITATDYTPAMISALPSLANVHATVADSQSLPHPNNHFAYSITNISLGNFNSAALALREIYRTLQSNGTAVVTHWKTFALGTILHKCLERFHGEPQPEPPVAGKALMETEGGIKEMLVEAGWERGRVETFEVEVVSQEVEGAVEFLTGPFLGVVRGILEGGEEGRERWRAIVRAVVEGEGQIRCEGWVVVGRK